jgi:hypothetical protein
LPRCPLLTGLNAGRPCCPIARLCGGRNFIRDLASPRPSGWSGRSRWWSQPSPVLREMMSPTSRPPATAAGSPVALDQIRRVDGVLTVARCCPYWRPLLIGGLLQGFVLFVWHDSARASVLRVVRSSSAAGRGTMSGSLQGNTYSVVVLIELSTRGSWRVTATVWHHGLIEDTDPFARKAPSSASAADPSPARGRVCGI